MPSLVTTTNNTSAIYLPFQRKCFWANGRFWIFYSDGTYLVWAHSVDGVNWVLPEVTVLTNSPTQTTGGWTNPTYAYALDGLYARGNLASGTQDYFGYGFNAPSTATVAKVRVRLDAYVFLSGNIYVQVSWDGGVTWGPVHTQALTTSLATYWIDVTSDTVWTPEKLNIIRVRVYADTARLRYLDWIPVEATYGNIVRTATVGDEFSIWFDGAYLHYAHSPQTANTPISYRKGTPNSDGTITWIALEQTAVEAVSGVTYYAPFVSVDSDGCPFISYNRFSYPYITKSTKNDGTWSTQTPTFPFQLSATPAGSWFVSVVPLTSLKMYVIYAHIDSIISGRLWDGSSMGNEEAASTTAIGSSIHFSVVNYSDDVHIVFHKSGGTFDLIYCKRTYAVGWGAEVTLLTPGSTQTTGVLSVDHAGNLYCFWMGMPSSYHIYYIKNINGTWDSTPTDWIDESANGLVGDKLTCFYNLRGLPLPSSLYVGLAYLAKVGAPYDLKFAFLTFSFKRLQYLNGLVCLDLLGRVPE